MVAVGLKLEGPEEADAIFSRERWNTECFAIGKDGHHVAISLLRVPEGMAACALCNICGGRREHLLDFRDAILDGPDRSPASMEAQTQALARDLIASFAALHEGCATTPLTHAPVRVAEQMIASALVDARGRLQRDHGVPPRFYLFTDQGQLTFPAPDFPESSLNDGDDRRIAIATFHYTVRELVRARGMRTSAVVMISEAWLTEMAQPVDGVLPTPSSVRAAPRTEALIITVVTPSYGSLGIAKIYRRGTRVGVGPGSIGSIQWRPMNGHSGMMDGLLATTDHPLSEERRARAAGTPVMHVGDQLH
jgi:hypothetical protein